MEQLKEILRSASELTQESEFYVIGSAAILNVFESPQHVHLWRSNEADLIALSGDPEVADQISVFIGELSPFHQNHNVYADGVTFQTPVFAPEGWQIRAIPVHYEDIGVTARYMELHDLTLSKLGAGRPKDMEFCAALAATGYLNENVLYERLANVTCSDAERRLIKSRIESHFQ